MHSIIIALTLAAIYSAGMWLVLAFQSHRTRTSYETETFHLGLCFVLSVGFLGLLLK